METCTLIVTVIMMSPITLEVVERKVAFCEKTAIWNRMVKVCETAEGKGYRPDKVFIPSDGSSPLISCVKGEL